ncbi:galacturonosyltransferase 10 [Wolffia australiana]
MRDSARRRAAEFRRPSRRRWLSVWWGSLWWLWLLCGSLGVLLLLVFLLGHGSGPRLTPPLNPQRPLNLTEGVIEPWSTFEQLAVQMSLAKTLAVVAKESNNLQLAWELTTQIRSSQALLSSPALPPVMVAAELDAAVRKMGLLLQKARQLNYDGAAAIVKLKARVQTMEENAAAEKEKSTRYGQIAAEELPKGLYCLGIQLTKEWYQRKGPIAAASVPKLTNSKLQHFCVFSDNVLATSVVVNSTVVNAEHPERVVFHLVTDTVNYAAMRAWFSMHSFRGAAVEVQNVDKFTWLNASYVPVLRQLQDSGTRSFYYSGGAAAGAKVEVKFRNPKYLSMLNHLRFYLPEVFPSLEKVVFLDDDVVVQRDLAPLFTADLEGNVMGAVETCMETFHRFHKYLNFSHPLLRAHFDPDACGWAFGMNVIDLKAWRKHNVTGIYHYWQERNVDRTLWKLGSLPPGLLTFYGLVQRLDPDWHVLGLGYAAVEEAALHRGAVLHWNGNQKPWLKIGNERYKPIWNRYVDFSHPLIQQCNVH